MSFGYSALRRISRLGCRLYGWVDMEKVSALLHFSLCETESLEQPRQGWKMQGSKRHMPNLQLAWYDSWIVLINHSIIAESFQFCHKLQNVKDKGNRFLDFGVAVEVGIISQPETAPWVVKIGATWNLGEISLYMLRHEASFPKFVDLAHGRGNLKYDLVDQAHSQWRVTVPHNNGEVEPEVLERPTWAF